MKPKEISLLIEKFKNNSITTQELARLKELMDSSGAAKEWLKAMQQDYVATEAQADNLEPWREQDHIKNKIMVSLKGDNNILPTGQQELNREQRFRNKFVSRRLIWLAAVAAFLVAGFIFLFSPDQPARTISWETIHTQHGERKKFTLSDGTEVTLNGNSSFSYSKTQLVDLRLVKLNGEAFFDVAKDKQRPFVILTRNFATKVLGTSFNIDSDIEHSVEVNTGVVEIDANKAKQPDLLNQENLDSIIHYLSNSTSEKLVLHKGEKASLTPTGWQVRTFKNKNWHNNELIHMNEPLKQVLRKAYRYFGDSVAVSEKLAQTKISISFRNKNIQQVLQTLAELSNGNLIKRNDHEWEIK